MLIVETIARIRREHFIRGKTIKEIARDLKVSRNTVRKVLRSGETSFEYERVVQPRPKLGRWAAELDGLLAGKEVDHVVEVFEAERPSLVAYAGRFDGFHAVPASVSRTCLVRFDNNRYSVAANAVGRPVEIRAYADRIELRQEGRIVGEHRRSFGWHQTVYDPWHYVPVLARKPGALRNARRSRIGCCRRAWIGCAAS